MTSCYTIKVATARIAGTEQIISSHSLGGANVHLYIIHDSLGPQKPVSIGSSVFAGLSDVPNRQTHGSQNVRHL